MSTKSVAASKKKVTNTQSLTLKDIFKSKDQNKFLLLIRNFPLDFAIFGTILILYGASLFTMESLESTIAGLVNINQNLHLDILNLSNQSGAILHTAIIGTMMFIVAKWWGVKMDGITFMVIMLAIAFGFLGKSIIAFPFAVFASIITAKAMQKQYSAYFIPTAFSLSLSPVFKIIWNSDLPGAEIWAALTIMVIAMVLSTVSALTSKLHEGYTLANGAAAAGIIALIANAIMNAVGLGNGTGGFDGLTATVDGNPLWHNSFNDFTIALFGTMIIWYLILALLVNDWNNKFKDFMLKESGRLPSDFPKMYGFSNTMANTAILLSTALLFMTVFDIKANGYVIAALFQLTAFSTFGKTPRPALVVAGGVVTTWLISNHLGTPINGWDKNIMFAIAIYSTLLVPLVDIGYTFLFIAGALHIMLLPGIGRGHGGILLYSNGMTSLFVTTFILGASRIFSWKQLKTIGTDEDRHSQEKKVSMRVAAEITYFMLNKGIKSPSVTYTFDKDYSEIVFKSHSSTNIFKEVTSTLNEVERDYTYETEFATVLGQDTEVTNIELLGKLIDVATLRVSANKNHVLIIKRLID